MGLFDKNYEKSSDNLYADVEKYLKPRDGMKHIIMINTMTKSITNGLECDNKYTIQIDSIIEQMQKIGYDIIDVKIDNTSYQSMGNAYLIRTLIIYK